MQSISDSDYKGIIQNIVWAKCRIDIESRENILTNSDIVTTTNMPNF